MTLQKRVSAPGKARRAKKNKPRHTKAQKRAAKAEKAKKAVAKKPRRGRTEPEKNSKPKKSFGKTHSKIEKQKFEKPKAKLGDRRETPHRDDRREKPRRDEKREYVRRDEKHKPYVKKFEAKPVRKFEVAKPIHAAAGKGFRELGIPSALANALYVQGITQPFPIQEATLPDALAGNDILGRGQTGSGKTLAFSLALLTRISAKKAKPHHPLALILTPTRELAQQIDEVLRPLARAVGHESVVIAGGMAYGKQINAMRKSTAILVATPGRLIDLLNKGEVKLDDLQITVLDEADQMADMGFLPVVKEILDQAKPDGQRMLFSATLDRDVDSLVKKYLKDPKVHSLHSEKSAVSTMEHYILIIKSENKEEILAEIASRHGKTIIFVKTQRGADRVTDKLMHAGVPAGALHGGKSQAVRTRTLKLFKESPDSVLVATDVAARGIHVDGISLVVHADPAQSHKDYLHRSGRTARAGESGVVVSIAPTRQRKSIASLVSRAGVESQQIEVEPMSQELVRITGARKPSGIPFVPPKEERPKGGKPRRGGPSRGRGRNNSRSKQK